MQHVLERVEMHIGFMMGKPERNSPLGRPRRRWENNIKMDLLEVSGGGMYWIDLAQDSDR
jgi:hypothetical protein